MTLKRAFWVVGLVGLLPMIWALYVRFFVHPDQSDLGSVVPWGLHVAQYIYSVGLSAGASCSRRSSTWRESSGSPLSGGSRCSRPS